MENGKNLITDDADDDNYKDVTRDPIRIKRQKRRATLFSFFAAYSLLMCCAFATNMQSKIGIPSMVVYVMGGVGGVLTLLLNLAADLNGFSRKNYMRTARVFTVNLVLMNIFAFVLAIKSYPTFTTETMLSILTFAGFLLVALWCLKFLIAVIGEAAPEDSVPN